MAEGPKTLFCAGAVKAGTSWLWDYLSSHPEAHFRTIKELQFFNKAENGAMDKRARELMTEIEGLERELTNGTAKWPTWIARQIADRMELRQAVQGFDGGMGGYTDYLTAGAGQARLVADMTPEYGLLPAARMAALTAALPSVHWVFVMRDPVERMWSHLRMLTRRSKCAPADTARVAAEIAEKAFAGRAQDVTLRSDYQAIHGRLIEGVEPSRRLVMFYEQLISPKGVAQVTDFLGLSAHPAKFDRMVHQGIDLTMPTGFAERARSWLAPQYAYVAQHWGIPAEWSVLEQQRRSAA